MINVVIADDHRIVAEGVARLINESDAAQVVAMAATIAEAAALVQQYRPTVLLLDVAMPDGDGLDAIPQLLARCPETKVVVLTMYAEVSVIRRAFCKGASGFLLKSATADELIMALQVVTGGNTFICGEATAICHQQKEVPVSLTPREQEVLRLIVEGKTIKEIADELCLGFETIHSYTKYLRQKLGCNNTASLVRIAIRQGLV